MLDSGAKGLLEYCEVGRSSKDLLRSISPFPGPVGNLSVSPRSLVVAVTGGASAGPDSGSAGSRMDGTSESED